MKYLVEPSSPLDIGTNCILRCVRECGEQCNPKCNCNYRTCGCYNPGNEGSVCGTHCWGDMTFPIDPWSLE